MNMNEQASETTDDLVEAVVGAAYEVGNVLGAGFLEKVYERALARELVLRGLKIRTQVAYAVTYKGQTVGDYAADLLVEERLIVELKCKEGFANEHLAQCINYLEASGLRTALLVNFHKSKVQWRRVVFG
jgi:GxxExxY protein